jgi:predicted nucleic acid-binding protein
MLRIVREGRGQALWTVAAHAVSGAQATQFQSSSASRFTAGARHLMYAVHNKCDYFVTVDNDFLRRRSQLTPLCGNTKIVRPSELAAHF